MFICPGQRYLQNWCLGLILNNLDPRFRGDDMEKNMEKKIIGSIHSPEAEEFIALSTDPQEKKEMMTVNNIKVYFNVCFIFWFYVLYIYFIKKQINKKGRPFDAKVLISW